MFSNIILCYLTVQHLLLDFPACEQSVGVDGGNEFDFRPSFYSSGSALRAVRIYTTKYNGDSMVSG